MMVPTKGGTPKPLQMVLYWHSDTNSNPLGTAALSHVLTLGRDWSAEYLKPELLINPGAYVQLILGFFHINETGTKSSKHLKCRPNDIELVRCYPEAST